MNEGTKALLEYVSSRNPVAIEVVRLSDVDIDSELRKHARFRGMRGPRIAPRSPKERELQYIMWQNRSVPFYIAARLLYIHEQFRAAAFCSNQALESLVKGTLIYWDTSFNPEDANHKMAGMLKSVRNKVPGGSAFEIPSYFYKDKRYQSVSRYPSNGIGLEIPATFLEDIDTVFLNLICLVPFQFNSQLVHILRGDRSKDLSILGRRNKTIRKLRGILAKRCPPRSTRNN